MFSLSQLRNIRRSLFHRRIKTTRQSKALGIENLETRKLMTVTYDAVSDMVNIQGTGGADTYAVSTVSLGGGANAVRVTENGVNFDFNTVAQPVLSIRADLRGGNDVFAMANALAIPAAVLGKAGNDSITTGAGNDFVSGGSGVDTIITNSGNDTAVGGSDNDTIRGGPDNDNLRGDDGADIIFAGGRRGSD